MTSQNTTDEKTISYSYKDIFMRTTKDCKLTIRLSKDEKQKLKNEAKRMNLDTSKFVREHFIKLISDK